MSFSNWMSLLKDEAKLVNIVMPGSHNSGCRKMIMPIANCQCGDLAEQFRYGVRLFSIRLDMNLFKNKVVYSHSLIRGLPIENDLKALRKIMDENPSEFFILDIRDYGRDHFGPFSFNFHADFDKVDALLEKTLEPSKYALNDFENIADVTMGDIRKSGKRFLLMNDNSEYKYSVKVPNENPWSTERHGRLAPVFAERATEVFDQYEKKGIFILQTQQTCGFGTELGITTPARTEKSLRPYYERIINKIKENPKYLDMVNVVSSDYMSKDDFKAKKIIALNLLKGNVEESKIEEFNNLIK